MGIRIHKVIGYGFTDFVETEPFKVQQEEAYDVTLARFYTWCDERWDDILKLPCSPVDQILFQSYVGGRNPRLKKMKTEKLGTHIVIDTEFGLPNVLLFTCPHSQGWNRYDDIIDYYEAWRDDDQALEPTVKLLETGIYPYDRGTAPLAIGAVLLWLGLESRFLDLKPMVYTYWS
jgi:hypothetical protein